MGELREYFPRAALRRVIQDAYYLSRQQGMGLLDPAGRRNILADAEISHILESAGIWPPGVVAVMDYVRGRSVKLRIMQRDDEADELYVERPWYDHTDEQLDQLLAAARAITKLCDRCRKPLSVAHEVLIAGELEMWCEFCAGLHPDDRPVRPASVRNQGGTT